MQTRDRNEDASPEPAGTLRTPPHNFEAEMMVLGNALSSRAAFDVMRQIITTGEAFADDRHGHVWHLLCGLADAGKSPDVVTLKGQAERDARLIDLGGQAYLAKLVASVTTAVNARDYARTVVDLHRRRKMLATMEDATRRLYAGDLTTTADAIAADIERELTAVIADAGGGHGLTLEEAVAQAVAEAEAAHRGEGDARLTDIAALDGALGGMNGGDLIIVAGRPGMGKTALGMTIARNVALREARTKKRWTAVFSLEMHSTALARRLLAADADVAVADMRKGHGAVTQEGWQRIARAQPGLALPIHLDHRSGQTVAEMRAKSSVIKRRHGLALIVVDHLGKAGVPPDIARHGLTACIEHVSGGLKAMAKDLDVPVLALCQLNRGPEGREDKRPNMGDLRQSGAIEQDADAVALLYRQAYYDQQRPPKREPSESTGAFNARFDQWQRDLRDIERETEVNLPKVRDGEATTVQLDFDPRRIAFTDRPGAPR